jgi:hypothetical protein
LKTSSPPLADPHLRVEQVRILLREFRLERLVHLAFASIAVCLLLVSAARVIYAGTSQPSDLGFIFGSSGILAYAMSRVIYLFDRALEFIARDGKR